MKKWIIICLFYLALTISDACLTFYNTPDLKLEDNPLLLIFPQNWLALIFSNLIVFVLFGLMTYYSFVRYKPIQVKTNCRKEYVSYLFFERTDKFSWFFYKTPKKFAPTLAVLGFCFGFTLITARIIVVLQWIAITFKTGIDFLYNLSLFFPLGRIDIFVGFFACLLFLVVWINNQYKRYSVKIQTQETQINSIGEVGEANG